MYAISQSLTVFIESTFEGVDGRCFCDMVWESVPDIHYPVTVE